MPVLLSAFLAGCTTANYSRQDINEIPVKKAESLVKIVETMPTPKFKGDIVDSLSYEDTKKVVEKYENLPEQKIMLYFPTDKIISEKTLERESEARVLDTTGLLNQYADEIKRLEDLIPEKSKRIRLSLAEADRKQFATQRSGDNQLSIESGLFGVDSYYASGNGQFLIDVKEVTGVGKDFRNKKEFRISVLFGQEAFNAMKERKDWLAGLTFAEDVAMGGAMGGAYGAGGVAAGKLIDGVWAYFEGINPPEGTFMSDNRFNISKLEEKSSDVYSALKVSKEENARSCMTVPYSNGAGLVRAGYATKVVYKDNEVIFNTDEKGVHHLKDLIYRLLQVGTRFGSKGKNGTDEKCEPHGGNRTGGFGGGGASSGGGSSGGAGGG